MLHDEVIVAYQPIVALATGDVVAHEALLRWSDPDRPQAALSARLVDLEASGDIGRISVFVLETAALAWPHLGGDLHVNISARDLADSVVLALATEVACQAPGCGRLVLEVTEHQPIRGGAGLADRLHGLRAAGIRVAMDDFGTGWANMRSMQILEPETIKIDRRLLGSGDDLFVVEWVLALARGVGADVCFEGVEHASLATRLRRLRVPKAQGYYFGAAVPAAVGGELAEPRSTGR
ncbi:MAG: diguanylate cyclase/phosphodiesterase [Acidimicrobiales bacterium]|nr:diguanylate cyclase/phosphodiesterase [Acidimicrobiales bacterium]